MNIGDLNYAELLDHAGKLERQLAAKDAEIVALNAEVERKVSAANFLLAEREKQLAAKDAEIETLYTALNSDWGDGVMQANLLAKRQLAEREKQIVMLRSYLEQLACLGNGDQHGNSIGNDIAIKALAAADDLSDCILCDADPVSLLGGESGTLTELLYKARTK